MEMESKKQEPRVLAREVARQLTPAELLQAAGAGGNSTMASSCTGSDRNPCDLDWLPR